MYATSASPSSSSSQPGRGMVKKQAGRVQHAAEGRRDHRDQSPRERRADRRSPLDGEDDALMGHAAARRSGSTNGWRGPRDRGCRACACAGTTRRSSSPSPATRMTCSSSPNRATASARRCTSIHARRGAPWREDVQLNDAKGKLAGARVCDGYQLMLISTGGTVIRMSVDEIKRLGGGATGVCRSSGTARRCRASPRSSAEDVVESRRRGRSGCRSG